MKKKDVFGERKLRTAKFLGKAAAFSSNHTRNGVGSMGLQIILKL